MWDGDLVVTVWTDRTNAKTAGCDVVSGRALRVLDTLVYRVSLQESQSYIMSSCLKSVTHQVTDRLSLMFDGLVSGFWKISAVIFHSVSLQIFSPFFKKSDHSSIPQSASIASVCYVSGVCYLLGPDSHGSIITVCFHLSLGFLIIHSDVFSRSPFDSCLCYWLVSPRVFRF